MNLWVQQGSPKADYLRSTCDHLLQDTTSEADSDQPTDPDGLLGQEEDSAVVDEVSEPISSDLALKLQRRRAFFIRTLALLCACSLSVGSH